jgi:hypothetical protein
MNIGGTLSHLGGAAILRAHAAEYEQLRASIALDPSPPLSNTISITDLSRRVLSALSDVGWDTDIPLSLSGGRRTRFRVDLQKNGVVGDISLGKQSFLLATLLASFPLAYRKSAFEVAVILVPMRDLATRMVEGVSTFEFTREVLQELAPVPVRYPFTILGLTSHDELTDVDELSYEEDTFCSDVLGSSFADMLALGEQATVEFKREMPQNGLAKSLCAMANQTGGGVLFLGIDDSGEVCGLPHGTDYDELSLRIGNIVQNDCRPSPRFALKRFCPHGYSDLTVCAIRIFELEVKPCMTGDKVFVRYDASTRAADAHEIRRLVK